LSLDKNETLIYTILKKHNFKIFNGVCFISILNLNISEKIGNSHFFIYYANGVTLEIWISFLPCGYTYEPEKIYICSGDFSFFKKVTFVRFVSE